ncbi:hypothetical protein [Kribbella sp. CA-294648]|uniref:hypothetical protein n=1 Tax=Kribbella sp. CA-294648 TaxID=3239948 RepID=UPI003D903316
MSYPPPPGPSDPRPQDRPGQNPGWQSQPYQPQGGNWAAPQYGGPPRRSRAGLIIVVIMILLAVILGIGGLVAYRLTASESGSGGGPAPAAPPVSSPASTVPPTLPQRSVPTTVPSKVPSTAPSRVPPTATTKPTQPAPTKPGGKVTNAAGAASLAATFVSRLNAGNTDAAAAMACEDTKEIVPILIKTWIKSPTNLVASDVAVGQDPYLLTISGTTNGKKMSGMVIVQSSCIRAFSLSPS